MLASGRRELPRTFSATSFVASPNHAVKSKVKAKYADAEFLTDESWWSLGLASFQNA